MKTITPSRRCSDRRHRLPPVAAVPSHASRVRRAPGACAHMFSRVEAAASTSTGFVLTVFSNDARREPPGIAPIPGRGRRHVLSAPRQLQGICTSSGCASSCPTMPAPSAAFSASMVSGEVDHEASVAGYSQWQSESASRPMPRSCHDHALRRHPAPCRGMAAHPRQPGEPPR